MINPSILTAVTPGFSLDARAQLSPNVELERYLSDLIKTGVVSVPDGWVKLILQMFAAIQRTQKNGTPVAKCITGILEQDGELRVFYNTRSRVVHTLILECAEQAQKTCMNCGWPGELRNVKGAGYLVCCPVCEFLENVAHYR